MSANRPQSGPQAEGTTMSDYVAAIDQGTTSTRCMIFDRSGRSISLAQREHDQSFPRAGWVEHDAVQIWDNTRQVVAAALAKANLTAASLAAVGVTNQRETALVWDRRTGDPVHPAIVWQDTRTDRICEQLGAAGGGADRYRATVGLPLATYFSGPKVRWILDNVDGARAAADRATCCSAPWTPGSCGTSPAVWTAASTSPT